MHCPRSDIFPRLPNRRRAEHPRLPTQSRAELQIKEAAMGQDVRSPRGPRCIALVGPFQSGKTTLLEAILARTGAIPRAGSVDAGTSVGDASPEARQPQDGRRPHRRHHQFHGRQLHLHRLSRLGRVRARHARRDPRGRCRGGGLRGRREKAAAAADHPARARGSGHSALSVSQQDRPRQQAHPRDARDPAAGVARAAGAAADSDLERRPDRGFRRSRAGTRLRLSRAQGVRGRRRSRAAISTARRKPASRCWKSSPITTTR